MPRQVPRAVIMGGGISGLAAAVDLSPHFEEIVIVEQDDYAGKPSVRPHTPQGDHVHILLAKGLQVLTEIEPRLPVWLDQMGFPEGDLTRDVLIRHGNKWLPRSHSGIPFRNCTRPIIEHLLLRAARDRSNVRILQATKVTSLLYEGPTRVVGVQVANNKSGHSEDILADLTVGAAGRSSKILKWLSANTNTSGLREETLDAGTTYNSCIFQVPEQSTRDWMFIVNFPRFPEQPVAAAIQRIQGDHWLVALVGYLKLAPPRSPAEMLEMMSSLLSDSFSEPIIDTLKAAKPIGRVTHFTKTANRRTRFDKVKAWPEQLVVIGDAACLLNPRYGQGMTMAALGARRLSSGLGRHLSRSDNTNGFAMSFQRSLDKLLTVPWNMALMEDRLWAAKASNRQPSIAENILLKISQRMLRTVFSDIEIYVQFMKVAHLIDKPMELVSIKTLSRFLAPV